MTSYSRPEIFNTDQGSQLPVIYLQNPSRKLRSAFQWMVKAAGWIVMIERLWRSLKYECIYLHAFESGSEVRQGLKNWINFYNTDRPHSSLDDKTPDEAYWQIPRPGYAGQGLKLAA